MALIFESTAIHQDPASTATHVLLIGCETYPNMAAAGFGDGTPLGSPRRSVEAMADWFLGGADGMSPARGLPSDKAFNNPDAPLGSVEMLTSPELDYTTPANLTKAVTLSTLSNVQKAYKRWLARLETSPDSRGVFYFCGHGVGDGVDQYLICDDFGDDLDNPWQAAFHVSNTCQAAIRRARASLIFLIDACMEFSPQVLLQLETPRPLINALRSGEPLCTDWAVLRATTTNRLAYADPNGTARFTSALLQALRGHCGLQRSGAAVQFDVTVSQLRDATALFLARLQQPGKDHAQKIGSPQGDGAWNMPLHVLTKRPSVLMELDVNPHGYRPVAEAFMERHGGPRDSKALTSAGPAQFVVAQGEWTYGVGGGITEQSEAERMLTQAVYSCCFSVPST
ncbi:Caspase domain-containing protein [Paracidovorax valerianellae]|uniref:Caspase domain-containing protein n=1 Tax=Paracidovorax valerianellae TaxID=187868 RepID=A0A1G6L948_9BURK|nr:caspase family protein [Paracidovorax valerianellae]SDC39653.1 Caspase domain-containing protein [Paracidovorax valerianellae]